MPRPETGIDCLVYCLVHGTWASGGRRGFLRVQMAFGFRFSVFGCRVWDASGSQTLPPPRLEFCEHAPGFRDSNFGFQVPGFEFRVSGSGSPVIIDLPPPSEFIE